MVIHSRASDGRSASQCPLGAFATEMGYSRDVCFSPDNDHIERALTRLKVPTGDIARREALLSHLEHAHGEIIGVNLAIHVGPKTVDLIALDTFDGHQRSS